MKSEDNETEKISNKRLVLIVLFRILLIALLPFLALLCGRYITNKSDAEIRMEHEKVMYELWEEPREPEGYNKI